MASLSDSSFAWNNTSSDSNDSFTMAPKDKKASLTNGNQTSNVGIIKSKERVLLNNNYDRVSTNEPGGEVRIDIKTEDGNSSSSKKKKRIKSEPESDCDVPKKKKKTKHTDIDKSQKDSKELYDETHLDMKVKLEVKSEPSTIKQKNKKKKRKSSVDNSESSISVKIKSKDGEVNEYSETNDSDFLTQKVKQEAEHNKSKKKNKKSKRKSDSEEEHNVEINQSSNVYDSIRAERTNNTLNKDSVAIDAENTFDDSEDSSCGEISAIKCDDSNLHIISLINKSAEKEKNVKQINNKNEGEKNVKQINNKNEGVKSCDISVRRTSRISERIVFEDDDHMDIEPNHIYENSTAQSMKPSKLMRYVHNNKLKLLSSKLQSNSIITPEDEIWILKCPSELDAKDFENINLNIQGKSKIKVGGQTYEGSPEEETSDKITVLSMRHYKYYEILNLPLHGIIHLHKRIPKAHFRDEHVMVNNQTNFIPLPETKCRHPLFGSNYKKALKIPSAIAERLKAQHTEQSFVVEKRKKKKHKKDTSALEIEETEVQNEVILKSDPEQVTIKDKKRKKRKHSDDEEPVPKKVKKIKHDPESAEAWESEKAIEENLFNF